METGNGSRLGGRLPFRPDIDGLRAVAVGLVVLYHVGIPGVSGGFVGVDVFFVISGFLITNHLLAEVGETGRIRFARFYARRARRLLPASLTVLLLTAVVGYLFVPAVLFREFVDDIIAAVLYVPNLLLAIQGTEYLTESSPSPVQHFWSLGVEEQFYLLWPPLLLAIVLAARYLPRRIVLFVGTGAFISLSAAIFLTFVSQPWAFFSPLTRAWEFGAGALVAIATVSGSRPRTITSRAHLPTVLAWAGLLTILVSATVFSASTPYPGVAALAPVVGSAVLLAFVPLSSRFGPRSLLSWKPMQFLGRISYSVYLVHWPLLVLPALADPSGAEIGLDVRIGLGALSLVLGWLLHRTVERPFLRAPWALGLSPRRVLASTAGLMVIIIGVTASLAYAAAQRPQSTSVEAEAPTISDAPPRFEDEVPANLRPTLSGAAEDVPALYGDGCHLDLGETAMKDCVFGGADAPHTLVLFGDSHAAQWFPAIMSGESEYRVRSQTKSSCPPVVVTVVSNGIPDTGCDKWREAVINSIEASPPDLVVVSGFAHYDEYGAPSMTIEAWRRGLELLLQRLEKVTDVVVITDTPRFSRSPSICLSASVTDAARCGRPLADAISATWAESERQQALRSGADVIDLTSALCDNSTCGVILGDVLMYRDEHHLTATMSEALGPVLSRRLDALLSERAGQHTR